MRGKKWNLFHKCRAGEKWNLFHIQEAVEDRRNWQCCPVTFPSLSA